MTKSQLFIVTVLALGLVAAGRYFVHDWMYPYRNLAGTEGAVRYMHPIVADIEKARKLRAEGNLDEARKLLRQQLQLYRKRPESSAARELLGEINTEMFFSTEMPFGKTEYVVKRGDSLWRIARKLDSTPAVIMRTNNMRSDRIRPGDRLFVPEGDFTLTLDLPNERAVVHNGEGFFKQYPIVAISLPRPIQAPITTKITASTFRKDGTVLPNPSATERAESTPWLHLASSGYVLYGVSEEEGLAESAIEVSDENSAKAPPNPDIPRRGIALLKEDLAELQLLIDRGTPVTIIGTK